MKIIIISVSKPYSFEIGKILKDENSLEDYKIENGCTLHIVKGKSASGSTTTEPTAAAQSTSQSTSGTQA